MKEFLHQFFIPHWGRKCIAVLLAIIIWFAVDHSLTVTRNIPNIPVRVIHLPKGKTIEGMQPNGKLAKKLTLTVVGNKALVDELSSSDLEVVIDAENKPDEWIATISKKNLVSLNPEINVESGITRAYHPNFLVRMTNVLTDKIPILVTKPIGEVPRGYQFLDVWPYHLYLTVSGPEEIIKRLKLKEQRITFNLNEISKSQLDELALRSDGKSGVVSFFVPQEWKQIMIPALSDVPIEINDPQAAALRIDFIRCNLIAIEQPLPISLFFPKETLSSTSPKNTQLAPSPLISVIEDVPFLSIPLYASGVDTLFLDLVRPFLEVTILVDSSVEHPFLSWSTQCVNSKALEEQYVATLLSDVSDRDIRLMAPSFLEEYLRNRFRSYMSKFQLFYKDNSQFEMRISLKEGKIFIDALQPQAP
ncbi:MAG: hypothetical protein RLZZ453_298 [Chlamydiota bacterium]|jgi:hypothetical protein